MTSAAAPLGPAKRQNPFVLSRRDRDPVSTSGWYAAYQIPASSFLLDTIPVLNMADSRNPPLSYEASATTTHPHVATTLPSEVVACLKNSRFVRCPD